MTPRSLLCAFFSLLCIVGAIAGSVYNDSVLETLCFIGFFYFAWHSVALAGKTRGKVEHNWDSAP
jgi:hypothetical protein